MLYMLNIGDQRSAAVGAAGGIVREADIVLVAMNLAIKLTVTGKVCAGQIVPEDSFDTQEGTYICALEVEPASINTTLYELARALDQEAIAYARLGSRGALRAGALAGPLAALWGDFDPEQFRLPNGRTALEAGVYA